MAHTGPQRKEMETTESYRGPVRETNNVERLLRPANDNEPSPRDINAPQVTTRTSNQTSSTRGGLRVPRTKSPIAGLSGKIGEVPNITGVMAAWQATIKIVQIGSYLYAVQVIMWVINLIGLLSLIIIDDSWLAYLDFLGISNSIAEAMFFVSMIVMFLIGLSSLILAIIIYESNRPVKIKISGDLSLWISAFCLTMYLAPVLNIVPWMIFFCLYVVKSQADS